MRKSVLCPLTLTTGQKIGKLLMPVRGYFYPAVFLFLFFCRAWQYPDIGIAWPTGGAVLALGIAFRVWGIRHIGGKAHTRRGKRLRKLVTTGPFAATRNPLYLANIVILSGYCLVARLLYVVPVAAALTLLEYHFIVLYEEALLSEAFGGEYEDYRKKVPRWWVRLSRLSKTRVEDLHTYRRIAKIELGGIVGTIVALAILTLKELFVPRITFNLRWAIVVAASAAVFTAAHITLKRFKRRRKEQKNNTNTASVEASQEVPVKSGRPR